MGCATKGQEEEGIEQREWEIWRLGVDEEVGMGFRNCYGAEKCGKGWVGLGMGSDKLPSHT